MCLVTNWQSISSWQINSLGFSTRWLLIIIFEFITLRVLDYKPRSEGIIIPDSVWIDRIRWLSHWYMWRVAGVRPGQIATDSMAETQDNMSTINMEVVIITVKMKASLMSSTHHLISYIVQTTAPDFIGSWLWYAAQGSYKPTHQNVSIQPHPPHIQYQGTRGSIGRFLLAPFLL